MAENILPGEHDWMYGTGGGMNTGMGFPSPAPARGPGFMDRLGGLLGGGGAYAGMLDEEQKKALQKQALLSMGANLMANSGWSPQRTSFGQALGNSLLATQQQAGQQGQDMLKAMLLRSQIKKNERGTVGKTPSAVSEYEYAKANGFKGSFEEWKRVASAQPQSPAAIQEYEYWKNLKSPQEQDQYLTVKRSMQPFQLGEMGGGKVVFNRATGQYEQATSAAEEAAGASQIAGATAAGKVTGESAAQAQVDLPRMQDNAQQALKTLSDFEKHPGFRYVFGAPSIAPTIPGTSQAGALAYYDQIKGKTFLEAFNSLKGAGQITEIEGQKATDAIARLNRSQRPEDAKAAINDLRQVIQDGLARAQKKAGVESPKSTRRIRVDAEGNVIAN